ncbi:MAG TPA: hypothetical protein ENK20_00655 [Chromatiales bacterium]|nr:hypothetical protein [Chromatiales bacterium]
MEKIHGTPRGKRRLKTTARAVAAVLALTAAAQAPAGDPGSRTGGVAVPNVGIKGTAITHVRACRGPDPAVVSFRVGRIQRIDDFHARVELVAKVRNVGSADFRSAPGKQSIFITRLWPDGRTSHVLRRVEFRELPKGHGAMRIVRAWTKVYTGEEFPGEYAAYVSYDPDFQLDGNPANDDCNLRNNERRLKERTVMELASATLRRTPAGVAREAIVRGERKRARELLTPRKAQPIVPGR